MEHYSVIKINSLRRIRVKSPNVLNDKNELYESLVFYNHV